MFLSDLDTELQYAADNHIYLDLTLLDTSVLDAAQMTNGVQEGGHRALVTDATVQQSFLDNALKPLLQHIVASAYKDYVVAYDIMNEPERLLPGGWGPTADFVTVSQMQTLVKNCAGYIHAYGGGALATVGSAAKTWMGLGLDFYCAHYNSGPGEPSGLTPPPPYASLGLDKPCVVEEFTTAAVSFGLNDTVQWSAEWWLNTISERRRLGANTGGNHDRRTRARARLAAPRTPRDALHVFRVRGCRHRSTARQADPSHGARRTCLLERARPSRRRCRDRSV
jgi:hypothetical protein